MIFPGRQNGHIVIQAVESYNPAMDDWDHVIPVEMRLKADHLMGLLSRLDLCLYRALVRRILYAYAREMQLVESLPSPSTLPARWRYRGERPRSRRTS